MECQLSVDEMRARINDKIGDVLDDDLDCDRRIWNVSREANRSEFNA
jgi:hypothetical protein